MRYARPTLFASLASAHSCPQDARMMHRALLLSAVITLVCGGFGCTDFSYRSLQLGQSREKYDGALPTESSRRTDLGLCQYSKGPMGRTDAIVLMLSNDRRISAKIQAYALKRELGFKTESGFRLVGELDPKLYGTQGTGPVDTLRAVAISLLEYQGEALATQAYRFVAAGLVRLLERWPGLEELGIPVEQLEEVIDFAPGGGTSRIASDDNGVLRFEYEQGTTR